MHFYHLLKIQNGYRNQFMIVKYTVGNLAKFSKIPHKVIYLTNIQGMNITM